VSNVTFGIAVFGSMLTLMVLRAPISLSMFLPGAVAYWYLAGDSALLNFLKGAAFARFSLYDLSVIPLFILMGQFATQGGLSRALFHFANTLIGHFRGGMAMAAIVACALFGAVCGSSVATCATLAQVALPEMRRLNYSGRLATATLAVGGTQVVALAKPLPVHFVYDTAWFDEDGTIQFRDDVYGWDKQMPAADSNPIAEPCGS